ncbi:MAG TPA: deoxyuridine 5'-triphosphate nucleotidohydrolase, partial [Clostridiales bacterium]|nr:deoxyuridine 5'-triphosphate nucleotidohydrolase [Clostridiales bacterium]
MKRIAKFEKVSLEQFKKDWIDTFGETVSATLSYYDNIEEIYN